MIDGMEREGGELQLSQHTSPSERGAGAGVGGSNEPTTNGMVVPIRALDICAPGERICPAI